MRTLTRLSVPVAAAALLLAGCSSTAGDGPMTDPGGEETTGTETPAAVDLLTEGVLTVCTNPPYEPFEYEEGGEIVGLDIDIVREIANDLGADLEVVVTGFDGIQSGAALEARQCDIVASGITITEERALNMDFTDPYFDATQALLVPAGSGLDSLDAIRDLEVGVQQATTGLDWAVEQGLNTIEFEDLGLQIEALRNGSVDAVINDYLVLLPFEGDQFEVTTQFDTGEQYGFGVRKGNEALLTAANATLARIAADGTYDTLYEQYIGKAPTD